eukprot:scaffold2341_cov212-Skeletonema_menzelii.AAC.10
MYEGDGSVCCIDGSPILDIILWCYVLPTFDGRQAARWISFAPYLFAAQNGSPLRGTPALAKEVEVEEKDERFFGVQAKSPKSLFCFPSKNNQSCRSATHHQLFRRHSIMPTDSITRSSRSHSFNHG